METPGHFVNIHGVETPGHNNKIDTYEHKIIEWKIINENIQS